MKKIWLLALVFASFVQACSTDIDINADWKDTTLVIGLLNPGDSTHYIRIHKAFLDPERSAFIIAQIKDSIYYQNLDVRIDRILNNNVVSSTPLQEIDTSILGEGIFHSPDMILYRYNSGQLDPSSTYRLVINTPFGETVTAEVQPIGNTLSLPNGLPPGGPVPPSFRGLNWSSVVSPITFIAPSNAKSYDITIRVIYDEWNRFTTTPGDTPTLVRKSVDYRPFINQTFRNVSNNERVEHRLNGRSMFAYMNGVIPINEDVNRRLRGTLFIFDFADEEFFTFLQINRPSSSIVDVRPTYTNVNNGIGIFASRRSIPNIQQTLADPNYPFSSPFYREALGGVGVDSLRLRYPQLRFVP
ncbi:MAG: DUF4249 family protein [Bacteroidia bacterium]